MPITPDAAKQVVDEVQQYIESAPLHEGWTIISRSIGDEITFKMSHSRPASLPGKRKTLPDEHVEALESIGPGLVDKIFRELDGKPERIHKDLPDDLYKKVTEVFAAHNIPIEFLETEVVARKFRDRH